MRSFIEIEAIAILAEESIGTKIVKELLPKSVLHFLKRKLHKKHYIQALKLANKMVNDKTRNIKPAEAIIKAAQLVDIDPRELKKVMDKETRNK